MQTPSQLLPALRPSADDNLWVATPERVNSPNQIKAFYILMDPRTAWAAGLFEGEGSITYSRFRNGVKSPVLSLEMTDLDIVKRFREIVGVDNAISSRNRKDNGNCKTIYSYRVGAKADIIRILDSFLPLFGNRRAHKALTILDQLELQNNG